MERYERSQRLSELIDHNPQVLMAMSRFGISLGFGDKTVETVCEEQNVDCTTFLAVANFISFGIATTDGVSLKSLMMYLDNAHDYFLEFCLPMIRRKLIEAVGLTSRDDLSLLILRFYDEYVEEVRKHMEYEGREVFGYVRRLLSGTVDEDFRIDMFAAHHHSIHDKLQELKRILIRHLPRRDSNMLNVVLFDIINCSQDLMAHCRVEDRIFVPLVRHIEDEVTTNPEPISVEPAPETTETEQQISERERDIIACVAQGLSNKEIADRLFISVNTVMTHRRNIASKLQIHSPAGLTIYAVINGIIDIDELRK